MTGKPNYNDGNWWGWNGGECPVHPKTVVEVLFDDGSGAKEINADTISWNYPPAQPVAFRVIREHREPRVWWRVGKHLHETEEKAQAFLNDLALNYPTMDFGPIVKVVEVEE